MKAPQTLRQIWGIPVVMGLLNAIGLITALLADGVGDAVSWLALAIPVAIACWCSIRQA
ncbi:MAG: hypothetical protein ACU841_01485 [Gammaproteobacteria bacterium]